MEVDYLKISLLRKQYNMKQSEIAKVLGVSYQAVSKWENGISKPSVENIYALSKLFHKPMEYFFSHDLCYDIDNDDSRGMESLCELYKIGRGPSSSHTIGPERICSEYKKRHQDADKFRVVLYGSLAKTGKGHGTDRVIEKTFAPIRCEIEFNYVDCNIAHPNTMDVMAYYNNEIVDRIRAYSIGGGSISYNINGKSTKPKIYKHNSFDEISKYCKKHRLRLYQYVDRFEADDFDDYIGKIWRAMKNSIEIGLEAEGILPGGLNVQRKAKYLHQLQHIDESNETKENRLVCSYAFAVSEQNASGETIVTAPTCGAAGVVAAVLYYQQQKHHYSDDDIGRALKTAGLIGNLIKENASISGAECGCQVEIGSACAMAAAGLGELFELSMDKIEYASEIAIEHHLGLTCDPICGLVQIPCIERNAVAAMRAINAVNLACFLSDTRKVSFDNVVKVMKETGRDMSSVYKETSEGGLAKVEIK